MKNKTKLIMLLAGTITSSAFGQVTKAIDPTSQRAGQPTTKPITQPPTTQEIIQTQRDNLTKVEMDFTELEAQPPNWIATRRIQITSNLNQIILISQQQIQKEEENQNKLIAKDPKWLAIMSAINNAYLYKQSLAPTERLDASSQYETLLQQESKYVLDWYNSDPDFVSVAELLTEANQEEVLLNPPIVKLNPKVAVKSTVQPSGVDITILVPCPTAPRVVWRPCR